MNMDMSGLPPGLMQLLMQMMQQGGNWGQTRNLQDQKLEDPLGWNAWLAENHQPEWQPGKTFDGRVVIGDNPTPQVGDITYATQARADAARLSPYLYGAPQQSNVTGWGHTLSLEDIEQFKAAQGLRGDAMLAAIPERFRTDPMALRLAQMGNNPDVNGGYGLLDVKRIPGVSGGGELKPVPLHKFDYAAQYGYQGAGAPEFRGQQWTATGQPSPYRNDRHNVYPDAANIIQTLKGAGWDPDTQGWGPQEWEGKSPEQQTMLNDLVYSISPNTPHLGTSHERMMKRREEAHDRFLARQPKPGTPSWEQDPWAAMQGVTDRNAYVNDTLGGNFYGGVIPDDSMKQTWGPRLAPWETGDPHFSQPQRTNPWSVESPNDATPGYDAHPGWASNPSNSSFGNSPWGAVGEHSWQPPQQAPAWKPNQNSAWGGNQKGSANASPWGNNKGPWG
jgi:hypothetical protein